MKEKFRLNIQLFADGGDVGGAGGVTETPMPTETNVDVNSVAPVEEISPTNPFPVDKEPTPQENPKPEEEQTKAPEKFDPLNTDLSTDALMSNFDPTPFADMEGVNVNSPDFAKMINRFAELGVTDPQVQRNLVEAMKQEYIEEKQAEFRTPEQIKKNLIENLPKEVMGRYKETATVVQNALKGTEFEDVWQGIMEEPEYVQIADLIIQHLRPQPSKMSTVTAQRPASSMSYDEALAKANSEIAKEIRAVGYCSNEKRNAILKEIVGTLAGSSLAKFKDRFSLD